jgi:8-oxo-dGTP pyrophosphatase MutT (NUDIX family)
MKKGIRKAVFVVVYSRENKKIEYLLLKRKLHWSGEEFPKGGVKKFEFKRCAVRREVKEETGLKPLKIESYNVIGQYDYGEEYSDRKKYFGQNFSLYSAEVKKGRVVLDEREHEGHEWLSFEKAIKRLKWPNQRECLAFVNKILLEKK